MSFTGSTFGRYSSKWLLFIGVIELAVAALFIVLALQIPIVAGGFFLTGGILGIVGIVLIAIGLRLRGSSAATDQVLQTGLAGQATITGLTQTGMYLNNQPRVKMDLLVQLPGRQPYTVEHSEFVPLILLARLTSGAALPVRVDPADPQKVVVDWSGQPAMSAMPAAALGVASGSGSRSAVDESLAQVQAALSGSGASGVPATYASAIQANYTIEQLRAWLRANGLEAQARIDFLEDTGKIVGDERLYTMEMTLMVPGSAPEKLARSAAMVPLSAMAKVQLGATLPVRVAAENHHLLTMEWDRV